MIYLAGPYAHSDPAVREARFQLELRIRSAAAGTVSAPSNEVGVAVP